MSAWSYTTFLLLMAALALALSRAIAAGSLAVGRASQSLRVLRSSKGGVEGWPRGWVGGRGGRGGSDKREVCNAWSKLQATERKHSFSCGSYHHWCQGGTRGSRGPTMGLDAKAPSKPSILPSTSNSCGSVAAGLRQSTAGADSLGRADDS